MTAATGLMKRACAIVFALLVVIFQVFPAIAEESKASNAESMVAPLVAPDTLSIGSPRLVLKNGNTMVVLDKSGMIDPRPGSPYGLYQSDTRFLSQWQMLVNDKEPTLLTALTQEGYKGNFLYNVLDDVLIERDLVLLDGLNERIRIHNYLDKTLKFKFSILLDCDFHDMFEVRGLKRTNPRNANEITVNPAASKENPLLNYKNTGKDDIVRQSNLILENGKSSQVDKKRVDFELTLAPRSGETIEFRLNTSNANDFGKEPYTFAQAKEIADKNFQDWKNNCPEISTDWSLLNDMYSQSLRDLYLLRQNTPKGPCIAAGLPWYACAFGRDQCITALQTLPFMPSLARDVIKVLAAYQGTKHDSFTEEDPGRIMHELRLGEMAKLKEIPFIPYYGTVDGTPLWLMLMSRYVDATGDLSLAKELWPNVEAALSYIEKNSSADNGFLSYGGKAGAALSNQAWKDSKDSIMHKDGTLATAPIAVCEVQGYLYDAYTGSARLAERLGFADSAVKLKAKAKALKDNFKKHFWLADQNIVALAIDATAKPCDVVSSNPGHLLNSGILDEEMANAITSRLMRDDMFSGWGIRTLSSNEVRYNPISYHDGSIWPHDNAMIIEGMAAHGKMKESCAVMEGLVQSVKGSSDTRLPELFCGFPRNEFVTPVPYTVSCVPQAWAAGSVFQILKSILGIQMVDNKIKIVHPGLPGSINHVTLRGLHSGTGSVSVTYDRDLKSGEVTVSTSSKDVSIEK